MRIVLISDTHSLHEQMPHRIPKGDILIHAGDCTNVGREKEVGVFISWYQNLDNYRFS